ncbi:MAG TPA: isoprenylcysteine carboxylmethyltransferase family protein [Trueperaceae bacterium]|nr:isoprenylcysteine carboxylmethyltransferase family protein [Trueperaceae bacterium]
MYGHDEVSRWPRRAMVATHLLIVALAAWFLVGSGTAVVGSWLGVAWTPGNAARRGLLLAFSTLLWLRMSLTALVLLKRRFQWWEMATIAAGLLLYQLGFSLLGVGTRRPLGGWDTLAVILFLGGGGLNTLSEWARLRFKARPQNQGKLYTQGPFAVVRHPNYLGDILWGIGWALLTRSPWAILIVLVEISGFVFVNIPQLSAYLELRYGDAYRAWAKRTARLVPFLY